MELSTAQRYDIESAQARLDEMVARACDRSQHMLGQGAALREVLTALATVGEVASGPGAACSILILDKDGLLRNGASPNLPPDYLDAIDRLKPNPRVGTCAAAAATGSMVITPDFHADNKWGELRHLPLALGFVGAWSIPIKSSSGDVLGTFGTYLRERREPSSSEIQAVETLVAAAAIAIAKS